MSEVAINRTEFSTQIIAFPGVHLKKDGTAKHLRQNKKKGVKSEVYPFEIEDMKKVIKYFEENGMWCHYLIFVLGVSMARRVGDTLSLRWEHIFDPRTGNFRSDLLEIKEDKTDKLANPHINSSVRNAVKLYCDKTGCNPSEDCYTKPVFLQLSGNYKGCVVTADGYRKAVKRAAAAVGIEYNVGTHSTRKTFGMLSRMLHPNDYDSMELLQTIYNHSDTKTTKHYIGLTKKKVDQYYDDMGAFFDDYVTGNKVYHEVASTPIVSLDTNDIRDIIKSAYEAGRNNAKEDDAMAHIEAITNLIAMVEQLAK